MYKVFLDPVGVFTSKSEVEAVQFALSLHQASNVTHRIDVVELDSDSHDIGNPPICTLTRE